MSDVSFITKFIKTTLIITIILCLLCVNLVVSWNKKCCAKRKQKKLKEENDNNGYVDYSSENYIGNKIKRKCCSHDSCICAKYIDNKHKCNHADCTCKSKSDDDVKKSYTKYDDDSIKPTGYQYDDGKIADKGNYRTRKKLTGKVKENQFINNERISERTTHDQDDFPSSKTANKLEHDSFINNKSIYNRNTDDKCCCTTNKKSADKKIQMQLCSHDNDIQKKCSNEKIKTESYTNDGYISRKNTGTHKIYWSDGKYAINKKNALRYNNDEWKYNRNTDDKRKDGLHSDNDDKSNNDKIRHELSKKLSVGKNKGKSYFNDEYISKRKTGDKFNKSFKNSANISICKTNTDDKVSYCSGTKHDDNKINTDLCLYDSSICKKNVDDLSNYRSIKKYSDMGKVNDKSCIYDIYKSKKNEDDYTNNKCTNEVRTKCCGHKNCICNRNTENTAKYWPYTTLTSNELKSDLWHQDISDTDDKDKHWIDDKSSNDEVKVKSYLHDVCLCKNTNDDNYLPKRYDDDFCDNNQYSYESNKNDNTNYKSSEKYNTDQLKVLVPDECSCNRNTEGKKRYWPSTIYPESVTCTHDDNICELITDDKAKYWPCSKYSTDKIKVICCAHDECIRKSKADDQDYFKPCGQQADKWKPCYCTPENCVCKRNDDDKNKYWPCIIYSTGKIKVKCCAHDECIASCKSFMDNYATSKEEPYEDLYKENTDYVVNTNASAHGDGTSKTNAESKSSFWPYKKYPEGDIKGIIFTPDNRLAKKDTKVKVNDWAWRKYPRNNKESVTSWLTKIFGVNSETCDAEPQRDDGKISSNYYTNICNSGDKAKPSVTVDIKVKDHCSSTNEHLHEREQHTGKKKDTSCPCIQNGKFNTNSGRCHCKTPSESKLILAYTDGEDCIYIKDYTGKIMGVYCSDKAKCTSEHTPSSVTRSPAFYNQDKLEYDIESDRIYRKDRTGAIIRIYHSCKNSCGIKMNGRNYDCSAKENNDDEATVEVEDDDTLLLNKLGDVNLQQQKEDNSYSSMLYSDDTACACPQEDSERVSDYYNSYSFVDAIADAIIVVFKKEKFIDNHEKCFIATISGDFLQISELVNDIWLNNGLFTLYTFLCNGIVSKFIRGYRKHD